MKKLFLSLLVSLVALFSGPAFATTSVDDAAYYDPVQVFSVDSITLSDQLTTESANYIVHNESFDTDTGLTAAIMSRVRMASVGISKVAGIRVPYTAFKAVYKPDYVPIKIPIPV